MAGRLVQDQHQVDANHQKMGNVASTEAPPQEVGAAPMGTTLPSALVIVGPSGVGKGTLINKLKETSDKFGFSCSHTTRKPREGEQVGLIITYRIQRMYLMPARKL